MVDYLAHHGVKGMHWGVRRYQNADGTLTDKGRQRMGFVARHHAKKAYKQEYKQDLHYAKNAYKDRKNQAYSKYSKKANNIEAEYEREIDPHKRRLERRLQENKSSYEKSQKAINEHYNSKIDSHMRSAEKEESTAEWWGKDSSFYSEHRNKANEHLDKAAKLEQERNNGIATLKNQKIVNDALANEKFKNATADSLSKKNAALVKAGEKRAKSINEAYNDYKLSKIKAKNDYHNKVSNLK